MARASSSTLFFTRIKLRNWRNFRQAEVHLSPRAFFIGPNASGKSNLLDAFRFLKDLVKPVGGGLGSAVADRGGLAALRCLNARGRKTDVEIDVDIGTIAEPQKWSYHLAFTRFGREEYPTVRLESVCHFGKKISLFERSGEIDGLKYSQTLIEQVTQNENFRELATFFTSIRYLHVVPQIVRDPRRSIEKGDDPFGGDLLRRINDTPPRTRTARLDRIGGALQIAVPQFTKLSFHKDSEGRPHLAAAFEHWRPRASNQFEETMSDGTLRLIGFLWSIAEREGPLLLEEPELSLHDAIVHGLPPMIARMQRQSGRQVIATTHSEALVAADGIGLHEVHRLVPGDDGTTIETSADNAKVKQLVEAGFSVGEAVMPLAKPQNIDQLSLFDVVSG